MLQVASYSNIYIYTHIIPPSTLYMICKQNQKGEGTTTARVH